MPVVSQLEIVIQQKGLLALVSLFFVSYVLIVGVRLCCIVLLSCVELCFAVALGRCKNVSLFLTSEMRERERRREGGREKGSGWEGREGGGGGRERGREKGIS